MMKKEKKKKIFLIELICIQLNSGVFNMYSVQKDLTPWATETVLSPWLAADEARVSHMLSHVVWWKKKKKNFIFSPH